MHGISPKYVKDTIEFIKNKHIRDLNTLLNTVNDRTHAHYLKYNIIRPMMLRKYHEYSARLDGLKLLFIDHQDIRDCIKATDKLLHDDWQLIDFKVVALQRPGTKPPFFTKEVA